MSDGAFCHYCRRYQCICDEEKPAPPAPACFNGCQHQYANGVCRWCKEADPAPKPLTPLVALARRWAANDSLWTTQGMVEAALVRFWDEAGELPEAQPAASAREWLPSNAMLFYVSGGVAYFTTQPLNKQWGDDWNDAPYEHNSGTPYGPYKDGEKWEIHELRFAGLDEPCDGYSNSPYSVEMINGGAVAWLRSSKYHSRARVAIPAGTTMPEFVRLAEKGGGEIYYSKAQLEAYAQSELSALRTKLTAIEKVINDPERKVEYGTPEYYLLQRLSTKLSV